MSAFHVVCAVAVPLLWGYQFVAIKVGVLEFPPLFFLALRFLATEVSADDRFRIQDVLRSYVWANDSGSVERVVAAFTPDGIVQPATGERIPVRRWASETFAQPGRRGRQHWVQHIIFERTADGVTVRSYWKVVQGLASRNTRTLNAMGFYDDFCVKFDGRWLIKEKRIYRCDDETPLPW